MEGSNFISFLVGILSLTGIITFFVMAYRLKRVMTAVESLADLEFKKSGTTKSVDGPSCKTVFEAAENRKNEYKCPNCKMIICTDKTYV